MTYPGKRIVAISCTLIALAALAVFGVHPLRKVEAAPAVSPEMTKLQKFYLGTWEYTRNLWQRRGQRAERIPAKSGRVEIRLSIASPLAGPGRRF